MPEIIDSSPVVQTAEESAEVGWRVLDPDGNVVASGPCIALDAVSDAGEEQ